MAYCPGCGEQKEIRTGAYCDECGNPANTYIEIRLADSEWGNETMRKVAEEYFAAHPEIQFVEVYEHGGWYLGFRRDGTIWATANTEARRDGGPRPKLHSGVVIRRSVAQEVMA